METLKHLLNTLKNTGLGNMLLPYHGQAFPILKLQDAQAHLLAVQGMQGLSIC